MLLRVAALAVAPQVIRVLTRPSQAEAQRAVPVATEQHTEQPAPAVTSPPKKVQRPPPPLWQNAVSTKRKSPTLRAWWAPRGSRGPPSPRGGSRSWAYLHPRSYPINFVDPDGLELTSKDPRINKAIQEIRTVPLGKLLEGRLKGDISVDWRESAQMPKSGDALGLYSDGKIFLTGQILKDYQDFGKHNPAAIKSLDVLLRGLIFHEMVHALNEQEGNCPTLFIDEKKARMLQGKYLTQDLKKHRMNADSLLEAAGAAGLNYFGQRQTIDAAQGNTNAIREMDRFIRKHYR